MFQSSIPDRGAKPLSVDVGLSLRSAAIPLMHSIPPDFFRLQALVNNSNNTALVVSLTPPSASSSSCNTSIAAFPSSTQNHSEAASAGRARGPIRGFDINLPPSEEEEGCIPDGRLSQPLLKREREAAGEVSSRVSNEEEEEEREGEEEEGEEGSARKKLRLSKEQSALLEESFRQHSTLNPKQKTALANQLGLKPRQVEVWFQNRRARTKLKQTEVDCELLRRCYGSLREENRRLQKELQELRALRGASACYVTHDYYTSPPAATLAMCPSCEKVAGINPPKQHRLLLPHQTMELEPPPPSPLYHQHQLRQSSAAR